MKVENKVKIFEPILGYFETESIKKWITDMIKQIPDYIFVIPSSSTGKYHNASQCETFGQLYHVFMQSEICEHRLTLKWWQDKWDATTRDMIRCVPILHDAIKSGFEQQQYTLHEHPVLAGEFVRNTKVEHDIPNEQKEKIAQMCERHSGQWTTNKRSDVVLPEPEDEMDFFCHENDILSSRNNIDLVINNDLRERLKLLTGHETPDPKTYPFEFGKRYKDKNMTLYEVFEKDREYLEWMHDNRVAKEPLNTMIRELLEGGEQCGAS